MTGEALANVIHRSISGYDVRYVTGIRSRFLKEVKNYQKGTSVKSTATEKQMIDITSPNGGADGSLHFILPNTGEGGLFNNSAKHSSILIARPQLPSSISPAYVVALAVVQHVLPPRVTSSLGSKLFSFY